jgi:S-methylmethionine-dependent homocysteine/selenocysteine methylase
VQPVMSMRQLLDQRDLILMEASVVERLRRDPEVMLHPELVHAGLLYDPRGRTKLATIYRSYMDIAASAGLPLIVCPPTWRANRERVYASDVSVDVNHDATSFLRDLREARKATQPAIMIGGLMGCKNDCYRPEEGLSAEEAEVFHAWQIGQLADASADFLMASTLPNVQEAIGIARALSATGMPYVVSFVINRSGLVLDGTSLWEAIQIADGSMDHRPLGYMVNCAHPSFLNADKQPPELFTRLIGYQANASALDHDQLDGSAVLQTDDVKAWGDTMLALHRDYGVRILGGCCGTGVVHLSYLAKHHAER